MSDVKKIEECNCYPLHQPGMMLEVDSFNPLVCSRCKNIIRPKYLAENTPEKKLVELDVEKLRDVLAWWATQGDVFATSAQLSRLCKMLLDTFATPERRVVAKEEINRLLCSASQLTTKYKSKKDAVAGDKVFIGYDQFDDLTNDLYALFAKTEGTQ